MKLSFNWVHLGNTFPQTVQVDFTRALYLLNMMYKNRNFKNI